MMPARNNEAAMFGSGTAKLSPGESPEEKLAAALNVPAVMPNFARHTS
jgi:hypothetical protein